MIAAKRYINPTSPAADIQDGEAPQIGTCHNAPDLVRPAW